MADFATHLMAKLTIIACLGPKFADYDFPVLPVLICQEVDQEQSHIDRLNPPAFPAAVGHERC